MLKMFQTTIIKNEKIVYLKWWELNQNCSWKKGFSPQQKGTFI